MSGTFIVYSAAGPDRDLPNGTREQACRDQHAEFIDTLVAEGLARLGGSLPDEHGAILVVNAEGESEAREMLRNDPWYQRGILKLESVRRWQVFIDAREQ